MGDFGGVASRNPFDVLYQPKGRDSKEKAPAKHEAVQAKKAAVKAAAPAPAAPAPQAPRTGNKRGVSGAKGTRPPQNSHGKTPTSDSRGKRLYDRKSESDFTKNQGAARKGGLHYGGNRDLADEAAAGTVAFNATGATDATAAAADAKAAEAKDAETAAAEAAAAEKKRKEEEEENKTKSFAAYEAERAAAVLKGDVKEARKPIVGKEFKTGSVVVSKKGVQESLFASPKKEEKKVEKKEEKKEKKVGKKKEEVKVPKVKAVPISLDAFKGPAVAPVAAAATAAPKAPRPASAGAGAAAAGGAATGPRPASGRGNVPRGPRGPGGGPRTGGRGRGGAQINFAADFPALSPVAVKA